MPELGDVAGIVYTEAILPSLASDANSAIEACFPNPFSNHSAQIVSMDVTAPEAVSGNNTNTSHYNLQNASGTEIATLDLDTGIDLVLGVPKAGTVSGTTAQCTIAAGAAARLQREEIGTQPARIFGTKVRVGWKSLAKTS